MNSTRKIGSGRPEGRAREDGRVNEPGRAEERAQLDQESGQEALDWRLQCLQENRAFASDHERARNPLLLPTCGLRLTLKIGEPMGPWSATMMQRRASQGSVPLVVVGRSGKNTFIRPGGGTWRGV